MNLEIIQKNTVKMNNINILYVVYGKVDFPFNNTRNYF
jgi:hypothetical protein